MSAPSNTVSDQAANTDRELWRKGDGDGNGMSYYEPSIHVTEQGAIGINVGGTVYVRTVEEWHALTDDLAAARAEKERLREALRAITRTEWSATEGITPFQFEQRLHRIAAAALAEAAPE